MYKYLLTKNKIPPVILELICLSGADPDLRDSVVKGDHQHLEEIDITETTCLLTGTRCYEKQN